MKSTITEQQAYDKVEKYLQDALAALPSPAELKLFTRNRSECTDPTDNGPQGRFEISATYEVVGLDSARFPEHFAAIIQWWESHAFKVLTDSRPTIQYLFARNTGDAFDMSLKANNLGKLYLGATSPCVWPNGTPEPQALEEPAAAPEPEPAPARKPRRAPVDDDDFDQTSWTDGGTSY